MAGVECDELKKVSPGKRKAESFAGEEEEEESYSRAAKRTDLSKSEEGKKKMWLLPQEEVEWILAQSTEPCAVLRKLKQANPSLVPSPEEEKDLETMLLYECARDAYQEEAKFAKFQAWSRKGFVEVDYDYFGERAEAIRLDDQARDKYFGHWDFTSDSEDDDLERLIKRRCRRCV
uniref:Uncharacterized protein n=1 Tax=Leersia perrieri TaxID=77586 RepID=A0A0D9WDJ1_9ORYZ